MQTLCYDIFKSLDLPFETYLTENIQHENVIHEELEIIWLLKGKAHIHVGEKTFVMTPHTVFLVYMYREHSIESEDGSLVVTYRLKKAYLHKHNLFFEKVHFKDRVYSFEELAIKYKQVPLLIVQMMKLLISNEAEEAIKYKIIGYYHLYVNGLYRALIKNQFLDVKHVEYDDYLNRIHMIVEYTYDHFRDKISLEDLSNLTNRSTYRLSHFIKDALGIPYQTFLLNVRFENALKLLKESKLSIKEVVKNSGFSDHKYLNKLMKKKFNQTALQYRRSARQYMPCIEFPQTAKRLCQELKACLNRLDQDKRFNHLFGLNVSFND